MAEIYLFIGIESFEWQLGQLDAVIQYCKERSIDGVFLKVYEYEKGEWYNGKSEVYVNYIKRQGIDCIPYGFFYGDDVWDRELSALEVLYSKYSNFCLDMEDAWDGGNTALPALADFLARHKNVITYISTWANPIDHKWIDTIHVLDPFVAAWMPQEYGDNLVSARLNQWPENTKVVVPTYQCSLNSVDLMAVTNMPSIWEWQLAQKDTSWIDSMVLHMKGKQLEMVQTNRAGSVLDIPFCYQLQPGESQDLCGNYCVAMLALSGLPGKGTTGTAQDVHNLADLLASKFNSGPINEQGSTIDDMHNYLAYPTNKNGQRLLHWYDINPSVEKCSQAVKLGYPVIFTANELNLRSTKTGARPPYPWTLDTNHILILSGIDASTGDWIVSDPLNNNFEGEWPVHYDPTVINPSWATIVQVVGPDEKNPWLKPIPNDNPFSWPSSFNAQNFGGSQPVSTGYDFNVHVVARWQAIMPGLSMDSGIFKAWRVECQKGVYRGSPSGNEQHLIDKDGLPMVLQPSNLGMWKWKNGKIESWDYRDV